jgi:hypothetical protein
MSNLIEQIEAEQKVLYDKKKEVINFLGSVEAITLRSTTSSLLVAQVAIMESYMLILNVRLIDLKEEQ